MAQQNDVRAQREKNLERAKRLVDLALDSMTIESIRQLIKEIEAQLADRPGAT